MKKCFLFSMFTCFLLSTSAFAENANVSLSDKQVKPNGIAALGLDQLENNVTYNLSCVVRSDHASGKGHSDIQIITQGDIKVFVNRIDTSANNGNVTIKFPLNSLKADGVTNQDGILIQNLDKYDTIFVERCVAKAGLK